ncbi:MAG TPA: hypothetical protein VF727_11285 [Allosphingosinicella sp.]
MTAFRGLLVLLWVGICAVTLWALATLGLPAAAATFVSDLAHPWRAQFYGDLEIYLLLASTWIVWREPSRLVGFACAAATIMLGALFTLPYLLVAAVRAKGDPARLVLGPARSAPAR